MNEYMPHLRELVFEAIRNADHDGTGRLIGHYYAEEGTDAVLEALHHNAARQAAEAADRIAAMECDYDPATVARCTCQLPARVTESTGWSDLYNVAHAMFEELAAACAFADDDELEQLLVHAQKLLHCGMDDDDE